MIYAFEFYLELLFTSKILRAEISIKNQEPYVGHENFFLINTDLP